MAQGFARAYASIKAYFDTVYAPIARGVDGGNNHDHNGGDGAQINHTTLSNIGSKTHATIDSEINDGWITGTGTWSYSSADSPTFVISINADVTAILQVGHKIKLTQTTAKYFIVTAVGSYSGGATLVTVYGGTDYTLANAAITSPYYAIVKSPFGFPMSPAKWTQSVTDSSVRWFTPTNNVWAVPTGSTANLSIPIGVWRVKYKTVPRCAVTGGTYTNASSSLSTSTSSETDSTTTFRIAGVGNTAAEATANVSDILITLTSKTTYYIIFVASTDGTLGATSGFDGSSAIFAECAYL